MNPKLFYGSLALLIGATSLHGDEKSREYIFHHEHVLGTSLELRMNADSKEVAASAEAAALAEIDRLARILSRHDPESELMRWQSDSREAPHTVSDDLANVLERAEQWRKQTAGAFDVRAAGLTASAGAVPQLLSPPYTLSRSESSTLAHRHDDLPISLDGLAKGYIIDQACEAITKHGPGVRSFSVNIGGDLRKVGHDLLPVSITAPQDATEGARPVDSFVSRDSQAIATSGTYRRFLKVDGGRQTHLIDPRSGLPVDRVASATVIAPVAADADALATALCVLPPDEALTLVERLGKTECLILLADGRRVSSKGWPGQTNAPKIKLASAKGSTRDGTGLWVDFTLNRPEGGRYRRPFVAVWLEDSDGYPVKTALLWMQTESPGPRWHRDLTRWYRNDRTRKLVENTDLIGTVSSATRGPGEYSARFDGTDNSGKPLASGNYSLCLEVAREHGTYQIIREPVALGAKPLARKELPGNVEVSTVSYEYIPAETPVAGSSPASTRPQVALESTLKHEAILAAGLATAAIPGTKR